MRTFAQTYLKGTDKKDLEEISKEESQHLIDVFKNKEGIQILLYWHVRFNTYFYTILTFYLVRIELMKPLVFFSFR